MPFKLAEALLKYKSTLFVGRQIAAYTVILKFICMHFIISYVV